jgi:hypothetical protein
LQQLSDYRLVAARSAAAASRPRRPRARRAPAPASMRLLLCRPRARRNLAQARPLRARVNCAYVSAAPPRRRSGPRPRPPLRAAAVPARCTPARPGPSSSAQRLMHILQNPSHCAQPPSGSRGAGAAGHVAPARRVTRRRRGGSRGAGAAGHAAPARRVTRRGCPGRSRRCRARGSSTRRSRSPTGTPAPARSTRCPSRARPHPRQAPPDPARISRCRGGHAGEYSAAVAAAGGSAWRRRRSGAGLPLYGPASI